jgi:hypothetical protein
MRYATGDLAILPEGLSLLSFLYDLASDPDMKRDLAEREEARAAALMDEARSWFDGQGSLCGRAELPRRSRPLTLRSVSAAGARSQRPDLQRRRSFRLACYAPGTGLTSRSIR